MSEILTNNKYYKNIADTIRQMKGVATTYKPREMAGALREMYSTEVEGVPPLTFPSNGNNLLNYRIDGANDGVGDRTSNLFYGEIVRGSFDSNTGALTTAPNRIRMDGNTFIFLPAGTYTLFAEGVESCIIYAYTFSNLSTYDRNNSVIAWQELPYTFTVAEARYFLLAFRLDNNSYITPDIISNIMLNAGSNILSYEPYGYKIPVVCGGTTTNIYIEEPIGEDESISMEEANVNIPTINGTNTFSVDTTVQPSTVYVQAPKTNNYNL